MKCSNPPPIIYAKTASLPEVQCWWPGEWEPVLPCFIYFDSFKWCLVDLFPEEYNAA